MSYSTIETFTHNGFRISLVDYRGAYSLDAENRNVKARRLYRRWALRTRDLSEARAEFYRIRDELKKKGRLDQLFASTIPEWIDIFLSWSQTNSKSSNTYRSHVDSMKFFLAFIKERKVTSLVPKVYEDFKRYLLEITCPRCGSVGTVGKGFSLNDRRSVKCSGCGEMFALPSSVKSPRTVDIRLMAIGTMIHVLESLEILKPGTTARPKLIREKRSRAPVFWTKEEISRILRAAEGRYLYDMIIFVLNTGLRRTEAVCLRWEDINLDAGFFTIQGYNMLYDGHSYTFEVKDHEPRRIKLNAAARDVLARRRQHSDDTPWVFASSLGLPRRNSSALSRDLRGVLAKAGIKDKNGFHTARRSFAVFLLMAGVDLESIRQLLGHANISTTQAYLNVTDDHINRAVDVLDFGDIRVMENVIPIKK